MSELEKDTKKFDVKGAILNAKEAILDKSGEKLVEKLDQNNDGKIDIKDCVILGLKVPGVHINRREFLKSAFEGTYSEKIVNEIMTYNPRYAKVDNVSIEKAADEVIALERKCATTASAALGVPGGVAIPITLTADVSQYFAFLLRAAQKLMYVYGYPEIDFEEGKAIDENTINILSIAIGVMLGLQGADTAIRGMSKGIIESLKAGLKVTKTINPIKLIGGKVGVGFGKLGLGVLGKAVPIIGGVISGGLTWATFSPSCEKLRKELRNNPLNDPENYNKKNDTKGKR